MADSNLLLDSNTHFSGGSSGGRVFPSLEEFSTVCCDPHSERLYFNTVSEAETDAFLKSPCFLYVLMDVANLIFDSLSLKSSLYIWHFLVHVLLKPNLKDFELYFANMRSEYNCMVV